MAEKLSSDNEEKLTMFRRLDEDLKRYQLRCDELQKLNKDLVSLNDALETDTKDITEYLQHTAAALDKKVDELTVLLDKQQQVDKQDSELLKQQHSQEIQKLQEQVDKLNIVKRKLVTTLEEQQEEKEKLMELIHQLPDMESLEKQLFHQQEEHEAAVHSLKAEAQLEREKILERQNKEEMMEISEMLQEVRGETSKQMEKIQKLLKETLELSKQEDELLDREREMCLEVDELREELNRAMLEIFSYKKEKEQLNNKYQSLVDDVKNYRMKYERLLAEEDALRLSLASMSEECYTKTVEADHLRSELQEESSRRRQLESSLQKATITLSHILMDSENLPVKKMQRLLKSLEISSPQGTGSDLIDSTGNNSQEQEPLTSVPKSDRAKTQDLARNPLFLLAHFIPGDLGLVPRPTWKPRRDARSIGTSAASQQQDDVEAGAPSLQTSEPNPVNSQREGCFPSPSASQ